MSHRRPLRASLLSLSVAAVIFGCAGPTSQVDNASRDADEAAPARAELKRENETRDDAIGTEASSPVLQATPAPPAQVAEQRALLRGQMASDAAHQYAKNLPNAAMLMSRNVDLLAPAETLDRENYASLSENPLKVAADEPVSTLSIDVDTGAYANARRFLRSGRLPPQDAVRVEEFINYFSYDYAVPEIGEAPFSVVTELAPTPWNADSLLMQVGIKGFEIPSSERAPANLVFLMDVSGSMQSADKLPLLKSAFGLLADELTARDRISIVVYAGASGVVLNPTPGDHHDVITAALERLRAGGSTNGAAGIRLAYEMARSSFIPDGINRVILATDGDFNVGTVNFEALVDLAERNRDSGVSLTTLGFGAGNYNDHLMEQLADAGNGNHGYIDNLNEARKVLVTEMSSTLQTIAKDVKIQIEFNPAVVAEYRLIGYENRLLNREDFNNDKVDAGEIGAGHTVTALYEVFPVDSPARSVDPLRYASPTFAGPAPVTDELAFLRLRYKAPDGQVSRLLEYPIQRNTVRSAADTSENFRFAAAVAAFGQKLKGSVYIGDFPYGAIADLAGNAAANDQFGYRDEFLGLVAQAATIAGGVAPVQVSGGPEPR